MSTSASDVEFTSISTRPTYSISIGDICVEYFGSGVNNRREKAHSPGKFATDDGALDLGILH